MPRDPQNRVRRVTLRRSCRISPTLVPRWAVPNDSRPTRTGAICEARCDATESPGTEAPRPPEVTCLNGTRKHNWGGGRGTPKEANLTLASPACPPPLAGLSEPKSKHRASKVFKATQPEGHCLGDGSARHMCPTLESTYGSSHPIEEGRAQRAERKATNCVMVDGRLSAQLRRPSHNLPPGGVPRGCDRCPLCTAAVKSKRRRAERMQSERAWAIAALDIPRLSCTPCPCEEHCNVK